MKLAVVTGSNKGIGYEIARLLGKVPDVLCLMACRNAALGAKAAAQLQAEGCNVRFLPLDIGDASSIAQFVTTLKGEYGGLDILVNNAAIAFKHDDPTPFSQQARPTLAVNLFGTAQLTDALAPLLRDGGRICNVASLSGFIDRYSPSLQAAFTDPNLTRDRLFGLANDFIQSVENGTHTQRGWPSSCYGVSKATLIAYTRIVAKELAPRGIAVNSMCPGYCATDMSSHAGPRSPAQGADTAAFLALLP
eukprot:EG_transcript_25664